MAKSAISPHSGRFEPARAPASGGAGGSATDRHQAQWRTSPRTYNPRYPGGAPAFGIQWPVLQNANVWIGDFRASGRTSGSTTQAPLKVAKCAGAGLRGRYRLAGDAEGCRAAAEKGDYSGDVLRRDHATDAQTVRLLASRRRAINRGTLLLRHGRGCARYGYTRVYDVDCDAVLGHGGGHGLT